MSLLFRAWPPDPNWMQSCFSTTLLPSSNSSSSQLKCSEHVDMGIHVQTPLADWRMSSLLCFQDSQQPRICRLFIAFAHTWTSAGTWAFRQFRIVGWEDPYKWAYEFMQLTQINLISGRQTSDMAVKLHPLSAASFPSTPFSFPSSGAIFVRGSEVAMAVQVLFREGQECSCGNSLSFAFQCLHSWGFPVTK